MEVAHNESYGGFGAAVAFLAIVFPPIGAHMAFKAHNAEVPPTGREISFGQLANWRVGTHLTIIEAALSIQQSALSP